MQSRNMSTFEHIGHFDFLLTFIEVELKPWSHRAELFQRGLGRWLWCSGLSDVCFEPNKMIKYSALPKLTAACWYGRYKVHIVSTVFLRLNIIHNIYPCDVVWEEKCRISGLSWS